MLLILLYSKLQNTRFPQATGGNPIKFWSVVYLLSVGSAIYIDNS